MVRTFELKAESKKLKTISESILPKGEKEDSKSGGSTSNSVVDETEKLEKPAAAREGPLSEQQREIYMGKNSFRMEKEPIFEAILLNMVLGNSVNLKKKARIKVRDACVVMGVIDEDGILEEGEVFVRIQR